MSRIAIESAGAGGVERGRAGLWGSAPRQGDQRARWSPEDLPWVTAEKRVWDFNKAVAFSVFFEGRERAACRAARSERARESRERERARVCVCFGPRGGGHPPPPSALWLGGCYWVLEFDKDINNKFTCN